MGVRVDEMANYDLGIGVLFHSLPNLAGQCPASRVHDRLPYAPTGKDPRPVALGPPVRRRVSLPRSLPAVMGFREARDTQRNWPISLKMTPTLI